MKVIFGTTNKRKIEDLNNICNVLGCSVEVLGLNDIGWDLGDIDETGSTLEENSLIKANVIHDFCVKKGINYPIITDDAGLFCKSLNGEPGIYTARYADDEIALDENLPKFQCVVKLLRKLNGVTDRRAKYRCVVTCMMDDGSYFQESSESYGSIADDIIGELKKPYFYSVFVLDGTECAFGDLDSSKLSDTYRYKTLEKTLKKII